METAEVIQLIGGILLTVFDLAMLVLMLAMPFLVIYAIYRMIKGIMTHNANLKNRYNQTPNDPTETRWTSGQ